MPLARKSTTLVHSVSHEVAPRASCEGCPSLGRQHCQKLKGKAIVYRSATGQSIKAGRQAGRQTGRQVHGCIHESFAEERWLQHNLIVASYLTRECLAYTMIKFVIKVSS